MKNKSTGALHCDVMKYLYDDISKWNGKMTQDLSIQTVNSHKRCFDLNTHNSDIILWPACWKPVLACWCLIWLVNGGLIMLKGI